MGFMRKRKIAKLTKLIRNGMEQIDAKNYWDAIRTLDAARALDAAIYSADEPIFTLLRLDELPPEAILLRRCSAAIHYGFVLAWRGLREEDYRGENTEKNLKSLRVYDREFADEIRAKIENEEQLPRHYLPSIAEIKRSQNIR